MQYLPESCPNDFIFGHQLDIDNTNISCEFGEISIMWRQIMTSYRFLWIFGHNFWESRKKCWRKQKMLHIMQSNVIFLKGTFIVVKMRSQPLPYYLPFRFHWQISNIHYFDWFYPKSADLAHKKCWRQHFKDTQIFLLLFSVSLDIKQLPCTIFWVWGQNCGF